MVNEELQQNIPEWEEAIQRCASVPGRVMVMGPTDAGKSTLVRLLSERILAHQPRVTILDLDLGQSEVGPPCTIGLGELSQVGQRIGFARPMGLGFVGALTPAGMGTETMQALLPLLSLIPSDVSCLIDGHGMVKGGAARRLWLSYYEALQPDTVLAIQKEGELEPILQCLANRHTKLVRLPRPSVIGTKSRELRSERRARRLSRHLAAMQRVRLEWTDLAIEGSWLFCGEPWNDAQVRELSDMLALNVLWAEQVDDRINALVRERELNSQPSRVQGSWGDCALKISRHHCFEQLLCGLIGHDGICRSMAICEKIDFANRRIQLMSPYQQFQEISSLRLGRVFVSSTGVLGSNAPIGEYY